MLALVLAAGQAQAEPSGNSVTAEMLFQEGKAAVDAGNYAVGCPKLRDSLALEPGGGVALLLAICLEKQGKIASAWAAYQAALALAQRDHRQDREEQARAGVQLLEPRLARVRFRTPSSNVPEVIRLDAQVVPSSAWGSPVPVDPGAHLLVASREGHLPWRHSFEVSGEGTSEIPIPALRPEPLVVASSAVSPPRAAPLPGAPWRERAAFASLGAGAVALGLGLGFGWVAMSKADEADRLCPGHECADSQALDLTGQARSASVIANVGIGVGIGFGLLGGVLLAIEPSRASSVSVGPGAISAGWKF